MRKSGKLECSRFLSKISDTDDWLFWFDLQRTEHSNIVIFDEKLVGKDVF